MEKTLENVLPALKLNQDLLDKYSVLVGKPKMAIWQAYEKRFEESKDRFRKLMNNRTFPTADERAFLNEAIVREYKSQTDPNYVPTLQHSYAH